MNKDFGNENFLSMFQSLLLASAEHMLDLGKITENEFTALNFDDGIGNKLSAIFVCVNSPIITEIAGVKKKRKGFTLCMLCPELPVGSSIRQIMEISEKYFDGDWDLKDTAAFGFSICSDSEPEYDVMKGRKEAWLVAYNNYIHKKRSEAIEKVIPAFL